MNGNIVAPNFMEIITLPANKTLLKQDPVKLSARMKNKKKVYMLDESGNAAEYGSAREAAVEHLGEGHPEINTFKRNIWNACLQKKRYKGYRWLYENDFNNLEKYRCVVRIANIMISAQDQG